jgi:hypothetical protein
MEIEAPPGFSRIQLVMPSDRIEKAANLSTILCALLSLILITRGWALSGRLAAKRLMPNA